MKCLDLPEKSCLATSHHGGITFQNNFSQELNDVNICTENSCFQTHLLNMRWVIGMNFQKNVIGMEGWQI